MHREKEQLSTFGSGYYKTLLKYLQFSHKTTSAKRTSLWCFCSCKHIVTYAEPESQQCLFRGQVSTASVALLSIPSDSHLCTLHSQQQLASAIHI